MADPEGGASSIRFLILIRDNTNFINFSTVKPLEFS